MDIPTNVITAVHAANVKREGTFVLDVLIRSGKIAFLRRLSFALTSRAIDGIYRTVRAEIKAAASGIDGFNDAEADAEAEEVSRQMARDNGFEPDLTLGEQCALIGAVNDELETMATNKFETPQAFKDILDRGCNRPFNPNTPFIRNKVQEMKDAFDISEEHALGKLKKRHERYLKSITDIKDEIAERFGEAMRGAKQYDDFDDAFYALPKTVQLRVLKQGSAGIVSEAKRLRALDAKFDWDDMLVEAKLLEEELPKIAPFIRALVHASDTVATDLSDVAKAA